MVPRITTLFSGTLLAAGLWACGGDATPNPIQAAFAQQVPTGPVGITVAFRFPRQANVPIRLYSLPDLAPVNIEFEVPDQGTLDFVGFVREEDLLYIRNEARELSALDLTAGRFRTIDTLVQTAIIGPTGIPFSIREDLSIGEVRNRQPRVWRASLPSAPAATWGALGAGVLAKFDGSEGPSIGVVGQDWSGSTRRIPTGPTASTVWGDIVVVGTDSGIVALSPQDSTAQRFLEVEGTISALSLSPSGHRVYVATGASQLLIINRFDLSLLETISLPGIVDAIRPDPLGKYLLFKPTEGSVVWIAPVASPGTVTPVDGEWSERLPLVAPDGSVLIRNAGQVRAINGATGATMGSVADQTSDVWALLTWDPRRPTLQIAAQRSTRAAAPEAGVLYYAQVSSTSNLNWAQDEVTRLNQAGLTAALIPQSEFDDRYRVGLGPFRTREQAEETGRILGRAFFVVTIDTRDNR